MYHANLAAYTFIILLFSFCSHIVMYLKQKMLKIAKPMSNLPYVNDTHVTFANDRCDHHVLLLHASKVLV